MTSPLIPQCSPQENYRKHRPEIDAAMRRVLDGPAYILGREVEAFEAEFAAYVGVKHAIGVANGTDALALALRAAGVTPGGRVATVSMTASATGAAIDMIGASPLFIDVEEGGCVLDCTSLERALRDDQALRIQAIVPVHLYGMLVNMTSVLELAEEYKIPVIEDAAQAHGARWQGQRAGSFGFAGSFSFYPTKNLGAIGDGGCITTNSDEAADLLRAMRQYGWRERYHSSFRGVNSRLDELQAAILRAKLPALDRDNARRAALASRYLAGLSGTPLRLLSWPADAEPAWHQFVIRTPRRDECQQYLREHGISTLVHYPLPLHRQLAWQETEASRESLANTDRLCAEALSLPIFPELTDEQADFVIELLRRWCAQAA